MPKANPDLKFIFSFILVALFKVSLVYGGGIELSPPSVDVSRPTLIHTSGPVFDRCQQIINKLYSLFPQRSGNNPWRSHGKLQTQFLASQLKTVSTMPELKAIAQRLHAEDRYFRIFAAENEARIFADDISELGLRGVLARYANFVGDAKEVLDASRTDVPGAIQTMVRYHSPMNITTAMNIHFALASFGITESLNLSDSGIVFDAFLLDRPLIKAFANPESFQVLDVLARKLKLDPIDLLHHVRQ